MYIFYFFYILLLLSRHLVHWAWRVNPTLTDPDRLAWQSFVRWGGRPKISHIEIFKPCTISCIVGREGPVEFPTICAHCLVFLLLSFFSFFFIFVKLVEIFLFASYSPKSCVLPVSRMSPEFWHGFQPILWLWEQETGTQQSGDQHTSQLNFSFKSFEERKRSWGAERATRTARNYIV